jgi:hypothetical protein
MLMTKFKANQKIVFAGIVITVSLFLSNQAKTGYRTIKGHINIAKSVISVYCANYSEQIVRQ